jgi:hypothetical protein
VPRQARHVRVVASSQAARAHAHAGHQNQVLGQ